MREAAHFPALVEGQVRLVDRLCPGSPAPPQLSGCLRAGIRHQTSHSQTQKKKFRMLEQTARSGWSLCLNFEPQLIQDTQVPSAAFAGQGYLCLVDLQTTFDFQSDIGDIALLAFPMRGSDGTSFGKRYTTDTIGLGFCICTLYVGSIIRVSHCRSRAAQAQATNRVAFTVLPPPP